MVLTLHHFFSDAIFEAEKIEKINVNFQYKWIMQEKKEMPCDQIMDNKMDKMR
jgi:hypothetical protein